MRRLFAFYIGGQIPGCHLELHDLRFAVGANVEDCYPALKAQWWGMPASLHLDAFGALDWADGWRIELADGKHEQPEKLFLVHLGGYDPKQFTELHDNRFIVAEDARAAKQKALAQIDNWVSPHRDAVLDVDSVVDVAGAAGRSLRLVRDAQENPFQFEARYVPIGRMKDALAAAENG